MLTRLHAFLIDPPGKAARSKLTFWFWLSLAFAGCISLLVLQMGFKREFMVQDDARQHVFWMWRFLDPTLFPDDAIADYFQSVAPWGYTSLYRGLAAVGINPLLSSKLIPIALLLITTVFSFGACYEILPVPIAGFLGSALLNENLIMADDIDSATPRAFVYPLLVAFLYFWLRRLRRPELSLGQSLLPLCGLIGLMGLFYPQVMLVECGMLVLSLLTWERLPRLPRLTRDRALYLICAAGLSAAAIALLLYTAKQGAADFGQPISAKEAKSLPEFWGAGRVSFFHTNPVRFWLFSQRSGLLPRADRLLKPMLTIAGLLLPLLIYLPKWVPLTQHLTKGAVRSLWLLLLSSVSLFFAAHALLFKLHLPSRYTQHSVRVALVLAAGVALTLLLDALLRGASQVGRSRQVLRNGAALAAVVVVVGILVVYPLTNRVLPGYRSGTAPKLYQFLAAQPKDILIASIAEEADNIPTFAHRSVLASEEYGIVYHHKFYDLFRSRMTDLVQAHYSPDPMVVQRFTEKYGIDFWVFDKNAFEPRYLQRKNWIKQQYQPIATDALNTLKSGKLTVLQQMMKRCQVLSKHGLKVLDANCVVQESRKS